MNGDLDAQTEQLEKLVGLSRTTNVLLERLLAQQIWESLGPERVTRFPFEQQEIAFHVPNGNIDAVQKFLLVRSSFYELALLNAIRAELPSGGVFLDVGANIGNHAIFFAKVCKASVVHSFEPMAHMFAILKRNIQLNDASQIEAHNVGLGREAGFARVASFNTANLGGTQLEASEGGELELRTIDGLGLGKVDLIKIDVEGMQDEVLHGAEETLRRCKPLLVVEAQQKDGERKRTEALLDRLGYKVDTYYGLNIFARPM